MQYLHVNYGAEFNGTEWQEAFARNLDRGAYNKPLEHCSVVTNAIPGKTFLPLLLRLAGQYVQLLSERVFHLNRLILASQLGRPLHLLFASR